MLSSLKILYLGHQHGTSFHRAKALQRLGHTVKILDPWLFFPKTKSLQKVLKKLVFEFGSAWLEPYVRRKILATLKGHQFDLIWSDQCLMVGRATACALRSFGSYMVNYTIDDPFSEYSKNKFLLYRSSLSIFDLVVVVRKPNLPEAYKYGAQNVLRVFMSADEIAHRQLPISEIDKLKWSSDVLFIGTWMPERGPFLARLLELGIPLRFYGDRWGKSSEWSYIQKAWCGHSITGNSYVKAIQTSKICLGLLSKGNRDLHTTRSSEIPYIGSLLCAERTNEHEAMYHENKEAVFWSTPEECAKKCFALLKDKRRRKAIAEAGHARCLKSGYMNESVLKEILNLLKINSCQTKSLL